MDGKKNTIGEKLRAAVLPRGPKSVAEPEKELRFTRAAQAPLFYGLSVLIFASTMALFILFILDSGIGESALQGWLWLCLPGMMLCYWLFRLGLRCTRHAYIILSPLGVEIFPFFNPRKNLQVIYWTQVADAETKDGNLILHFTGEKNSGVVVSMKPIPQPRHKLLEKAIVGVMAKRGQRNLQEPIQ